MLLYSAHKEFKKKLKKQHKTLKSNLFNTKNQEKNAIDTL